VPILLDENFWREISAVEQIRDSKPPAIDTVRLDAHTLFVAGTSSPQNGIVSATAWNAVIDASIILNATHRNLFAFAMENLLSFFLPI
jgi:hypothetical protein